VLDALGQPVSNVRVAIPVLGGFLYTDADGRNYVFDNLGLDEYSLERACRRWRQIDTSGLVGGPRRQQR
jgi:hypothetical protein